MNASLVTAPPGRRRARPGVAPGPRSLDQRAVESTTSEESDGCSAVAAATRSSRKRPVAKLGKARTPTAPRRETDLGRQKSPVLAGLLLQCARLESNQRPFAPEANALSPELRAPE